MDMPWYGWLTGGIIFWMHAFTSGYAFGRASVFSAIMQQNAKQAGMPMPPGMPPLPGGR